MSQHGELATSSVTIGFLSIEDDNEFKTFRKEFEAKAQAAHAGKNQLLIVNNYDLYLFK